MIGGWGVARASSIDEIANAIVLSIDGLCSIDMR